MDKRPSRRRRARSIEDPKQDDNDLKLTERKKELRENEVEGESLFPRAESHAKFYSGGTDSVRRSSAVNRGGDAGGLRKVLKT